MDQGILSAFIGCLALISGIICDSTVDMQITQRYARHGENVSITCDISNAVPTDLQYIAKVVHVSRSQPVNEKMSAHGLLIEEYKSSGRFVVSKVDTGNGFFTTLNIHNVNYEDTGTYTCGVANDADVGSVMLEVYRNTEYLAFHVNGTEIGEGTLVDLEAEEPMPISCRASKATPQPELHIHSGDRDISDHFTKQHFVVSACENEAKCLLHFYYNASATNTMYKAKWYENGKTMKCKAIIPEKQEEYRHGYDIVETYIKLNVTHVPQVNCSAVHSTPVGTSSKVVKCPVFSNPELFKDRLLLSTKDRTLNLKPGDSDQGVTFKYTDTSDVTRPGEIEVTWADVSQKSYNTYIVQLENAIGENTFEFRLEEGDDVTPPPSYDNSSVNTISLLSLVFMAVMALASH